jgi:transposase-like protein
MNLNLYSPLSEAYSSKSQKIRVLSESWVNKYIYCPCCGGDINEYENNKPVADFYCASCQVDYELKSKKNNNKENKKKKLYVVHEFNKVFLKLYSRLVCYDLFQIRQSVHGY